MTAGQTRRATARRRHVRPGSKLAKAPVQATGGGASPISRIDRLENRFKLSTDMISTPNELLTTNRKALTFNLDAEKFEHTKSIVTFLQHPGFPMDVRHNSKIFREKLAAWADRKLGKNWRPANAVRGGL